MQIADYIQIGILIVLLLTVMVIIWQSFITQKQLKLTQKQLDYTFEWQRRKTSLDFSHFTNETIINNIMLLNKVFPNYYLSNETIPKEKISKEIKNNPNVETSLRTLMAHWENLALALHSNLADEVLVYEMVAGTLVNYVKVFSSFIEMRKEQNIRSYSYLLELSEKWEKKLEGNKPERFSFE